jgi:hypothetical protein
MAGHFPFSGRGGRAATTAFFEQEGFNKELQEKYYKWWYDWAKNIVDNDADLKAAKGVAFQSYPFGQHAYHNFHLNDKAWPVALDDLGSFIKGTIMVRMSDEDLHKLEEDHEKMLAELRKETESNSREPAPDIGYFRHT